MTKLLATITMILGLAAVLCACMSTDQSTSTIIQQLNATVNVYGSDIPAVPVAVNTTSSGHRQTKEVSPGRELSPARAAEITARDNNIPINQGGQTNDLTRNIRPSDDDQGGEIADPSTGADTDQDDNADNDPPAAPQ